VAPAHAGADRVPYIIEQVNIEIAAKEKEEESVIITTGDSNLVYVPAMFFNGTSMEEYGTNTYNVSWDAPAKGITIFSYYNTFFFLGCDFDVELFDYVRNPIGSCMSRCHGKVLPNQGPCNGLT